MDWFCRMYNYVICYLVIGINVQRNLSQNQYEWTYQKCLWSSAKHEVHCNMKYKTNTSNYFGSKQEYKSQYKYLQKMIIQTTQRKTSEDYYYHSAWRKKATLFDTHCLCISKCKCISSEDTYFSQCHIILW